jgi:hypothetical protein
VESEAWASGARAAAARGGAGARPHGAAQRRAGRTIGIFLRAAEQNGAAAAARAHLPRAQRHLQHRVGAVDERQDRALGQLPRGEEGGEGVERGRVAREREARAEALLERGDKLRRRAGGRAARGAGWRRRPRRRRSIRARRRRFEKQRLRNIEIRFIPPLSTRLRALDVAEERDLERLGEGAVDERRGVVGVVVAAEEAAARADAQLARSLLRLDEERDGVDLLASNCWGGRGEGRAGGERAGRGRARRNGRAHVNAPSQRHAP